MEGKEYLAGIFQSCFYQIVLIYIFKILSFSLLGSQHQVLSKSGILLLSHKSENGTTAKALGERMRIQVSQDEICIFVFKDNIRQQKAAGEELNVCWKKYSDG